MNTHQNLIRKYSVGIIVLTETPSSNYKVVIMFGSNKHNPSKHTQKPLLTFTFVLAPYQFKSKPIRILGGASTDQSKMICLGRFLSNRPQLF